MDFGSGGLEAMLERHEAGQYERGRSDVPWKGHRACLECRRKKTKCDMRQPICGLCQRTGSSCIFPTKRKTPEFKRSHKKDGRKQSIDPHQLERLVDLLASRLQDGGQDFDLSPQSDPSPRSLDRSEPDSHHDHVLLDAPASHGSTSSGSDPLPADDYSGFPARAPTRVSDDQLDDPGCSPCSIQEAPWLTVPEHIAIELIYLYFDKIQPWLPLLHRPNFFARYLGSNSSFLSPATYSDEDALLIYGILALAARHSSNVHFRGIPAPDRGKQFADEATLLYRRLRAAEEPPTLKCLQGCVLLAVYLCTSGPGHSTWILTGICVRMAYDLDLCNMDEAPQDPAEWTAMEERRRLFWVIWELDSFGSTLTGRPSAINHHRMAVLLPVNNAAWFAQEPVGSALLSPRPREAWKSLLESPNQDERAWFLLANYLMYMAYEMASSGRTCQSERDELVDALTCFHLAVSQRFSLETHADLFDRENCTKHNWIMGMHLMLTAARVRLSALDETQRNGSLMCTREFSRIIHHWHPETIVLSHPFLACILLVPHMGVTDSTLRAGNSLHANTDMTLLMLSQYSSVWKLGSVLTDVTRLLDRGPHTFSSEEMALAKRFAVLFPAQTTPRRRRPGSSVALLPASQEDATGGTDGTTDEPPSKRPPELLEFSEHPSDPEHPVVFTDDLDAVLLDGGAEFDLDIQDDWSSRLQLDYLCDDNQHFNYLQL